MLTAEMIRSLAPKALPEYAEALLQGEETLQHWGFNTSVRLAALLATALHETGSFTIVRERMSYSSASRIAAVWPSRFTLKSAGPFVGNERKLSNSVYGGRMGNQRNGTADDDGFRYRGGGMAQTTGFDNYKACGIAIGVDLATHPELIEDANVSLAALCWEMSKFLEYCDMGDRGWKSVCNGINRGKPLTKLDPIGWSDRQIHYKRCCDVLGINGKVDDDTLKMGDRGSMVTAFQERLGKLGYPVGKVDGIYGSHTRGSVLSFQAENALPTSGAIDAATRAAMNSESAKSMPLGDRGTETVQDLRESGSVTIEATDKLKAAAKVAGGGATAYAAASESGLLTAASDYLGEFTTLKTLTSGFVEIYKFALAHWYIGAVILAYFVWKWAKKIELLRVLQHRLGLNLSK